MHTAQREVYEGPELIVAFSAELADRVRDVLVGTAGLSERKMFGGLAFLIHGNLCCGIVGEELMVRVGAAAYEKALKQPHAREMDFTGRPMKGFVYVAVDGIRSDDRLRGWIDRGANYARSLPPK